MKKINKISVAYQHISIEPIVIFNQTNTKLHKNTMKVVDKGVNVTITSFKIRLGNMGLTCKVEAAITSFYDTVSIIIQLDFSKIITYYDTTPIAVFIKLQARFFFRLLDILLVIY